MRQFKAGDLAIIIGSNDLNELGHQVELIQLIKDADEYSVPGYPWIITNRAGCDVWLVSGDVSYKLHNGAVVQGFTQKAPRNLMPLRGEFTPETDRETELTQ